MVDVEASQWQFNFKYPNGAESNELYLLVDRPVVLKLTSKDVTHALYIPAFRVQRNAVPGQNTEIWFKPTVLTDKDPATGEEGFYHVFCTQYCGNGHAEMNTKAFVLNKEDYDKKLAEAANIFVDKNTKQPLPYAEVGKKLYTTMGCSQCHSIDGAEGHRADVEGALQARSSSSRSPTCPATRSRRATTTRSGTITSASRSSTRRPRSCKDFQNVMPPQESALSGSPYKEKKLAGHHRVHQEPGRSQVLQADEDAGVAKQRETAGGNTADRKRRQIAGKPASRRQIALPIGRPIHRSTSPSRRRPRRRRKENDRQEPRHETRDNYLTHSRGISSWIFTLDHKRIGVMYLISVLVALFLGGLFAMLIRTQLLDPAGLLFHKTEVLKDSLVYKPYNQIFTLHGAIMIFLVLIPGIPGGPGEFRPAAHAGGQGRRLPAAEPRELLLLRLRALFFLASTGARRGRHGLDVLHALQRADVNGRDLRRLRASSCWGSARSSRA